METGAGYEFVNEIVGGVVPREYIPAVDKGVQESMQSGVIAGYPVVDVKVTLFDGSYHDVDSNETAFKIAASMGFKQGWHNASPVLLEPMMKVEVVTPEDYMGDVIGDLNSRRGVVQGWMTVLLVSKLRPKCHCRNVWLCDRLEGGDARACNLQYGVFALCEVPAAIADAMR